jgi:thiosulfate/3-mercaptopyruvate sulfurtransferase
MYTTLISATELQALMQQDPAPLVMDCSFDLMNPAKGRQDFAAQHIPGSIHLDLDTDLSAHGNAAASGGRHPLPTREVFAARMQSIGLTHHRQVVVLDRQGANYCGRLWWMLKWCGHEAVAVLDGGLAAWQAAVGALQSGASVAPGPATPAFALRPPLVRVIDTQTIARHLGHPDQTLIDARAQARFRGEVEPLDPVAGHIPGALNRPFAENIGADGRFKSADVLRAEFLRLLAGRDPATVVHHCGSGVSAIPNVLAMELAGLGTSALYPGSWSEWCNTPGLPCARSAEPRH